MESSSPILARVPVEFSPSVWREIGMMRWESFTRLQAALMWLVCEPPEEDGRRFTVEVGEWVADCEVSPDRQSVFVLNLTRKPRDPSS